MLDNIKDVLVEGFSPVVIVLVQAIVLIISAYAVKAIRIFVKKIGIDLSSKEFEEIEKLVDGAVMKTNQKFVSKLKEASENGKLTDEQQEMVFNVSKDALLKVLDSAQVQKIIAKYGDVDEGLETLIEKSVTYNHSSVLTSATGTVDDGSIREKIETAIMDVLGGIFGTDEDEEEVPETDTTTTSNATSGVYTDSSSSTTIVANADAVSPAEETTSEEVEGDK